MTYNVFGGTLNLAQSISLTFTLHVMPALSPENVILLRLNYRVFIVLIHFCVYSVPCMSNLKF